MKHHDPVPPEKWGKDHLSLLLYLETRIVDHDGILDERHLRGHIHGQEYKYPTRLGPGYEDLENHNDFDCLADLIHFGYVEADSTRGRATLRNRDGSIKKLGHKVNGLTEKGWEKAQELRKVKARA